MNSSHQPENRPTAVIAGGGLAGIAAAIYLDELGYQITLIEKKQILGGRTYSFTDRITGLTIDNGQHLMIGAYHETLKLLERLGTTHKVEKLIPSAIPLFNEGFSKNIFNLGNLPPPLNLAKAIWGFSGLKIKDKLGLIQLGLALKKIKNAPQRIPVNQTVHEWLQGFHQSDHAMKNFWDILTYATLNDDPRITSADGLATVLIKSYFTGRHDGHLILPKAGLSDLFCDPAEKYLTLRGHKIIKGVGLKEIHIMDGQMRSFRFSDDSEHQTDLFVSALPFSSLLKLLPKPLVDSNQKFSNLAKMTSAPIVSINLFYDKPFMKEKFFGLAGTKTHWFFCRDQFIPHAQKNISHIVGVISGAHEFMNSDKNEMVKIADSELRKIYPHENAQLIHALVNKEREATLSSKPSINALRPAQKVFSNFYIIGDWTQTGLPATIESAVKSAKMMSEELIKTPITNHHP